MNNLKKYFHSIGSFIEGGYKDAYSIIGYIMLFGWIYHHEIDQLIKTILGSDKLATSLINIITTGIGALLVMIKKDKKK